MAVSISVRVIGADQGTEKGSNQPSAQGTITERSAAYRNTGGACKQVHKQSYMPRAKLRREPCDCLDCREPGAATAAAAAARGASAIARQEPPPKSLVICLAGALQTSGSLQEADTPHLDALVHGGWAGLLACRAGGPPLPAQLLGVEQAGVAPPQVLPVRFKQLRAVLLTESAEAAEAGRLAGCYAVHRLKGSSSNGGSAALPTWQPPAQLAEHICSLLRVQPLPSAARAPPAAPAEAAPAIAAVFAAAAAAAAAAAGAAGGGQQPGSERQEQQQEQEDEEEGDDVIDMLLLVLDAATAAAAPASGGDGGIAGSCASSVSSSSSSCCAALEWADGLLRHLNQAPGFRDTVLLSLVLGPGQQPLSQQPLVVQEPPLLLPGRRLDAPPAAAEAAAAGTAADAGADTAVVDAEAAAAADAGAADCPAVRRPLQSFQFAGLERVAVDAHRPALVVHRLPGVIRVDRASALDLPHILQQGAAGCILAERLLPEVAYKLGRAPKYGA